MNLYSQLLIYIKSLGDSDTFINTITKGEDVDLNKQDIYPLLNIEIVGGSFPSDQTSTFDVEIQCLDILDHNNEVDVDKFWSQDNEVDNHNETHAALNRIWLKMKTDFARNNITITDSPDLIKLTDVEKNILNGWEMTFTVELPNTTIDICNG